jgi:5-methylcytosine-specific restriction protein B
MGQKDQDRVMLVQFHQSYTYEDFIEGFRPTSAGSGFEIKKGSFYNFCKKAGEDLENEYFFIIDEINRGNMSKIFGELLMAIEADYREHDVRLAYKDEDFSVPKNLYLIGMMNTADRSLAMIDYALRRRFSFISMEPGFNTDGFKAYQKTLNSEMFNKLIDAVKALNGKIRTDESLGKGFCIGHSYLCGEEFCTDEWLQGVVEYDILPMLAEYWFDELDKYEEWKKRLTDAVK